VPYGSEIETILAEVGEMSICHSRLVVVVPRAQPKKMFDRRAASFYENNKISYYVSCRTPKQ